MSPRFGSLVDRLAAAEPLLDAGDDTVVRLLADEYRLPLVDPRTADVPAAAIAAVPHMLARRHVLVPVALQGAQLTVAMADPTDPAAVAELKFSCGLDVRIAVAPRLAVQEAIERLYGPASELAEALSGLVPPAPAAEPTATVEASDTEAAPVVRFVNALLAEAVRRRASDIHVEPYDHTLRIRFRIDGVLGEVTPPPPGLAGAIATRVKVMAQLDIAERRLPQDGRLRLSL